LSVTIETSLNGKNSMKALLLSQYKQLDIVDVPVPPPGLDEVLVRVAACGICGSDVEAYNQPYWVIGRNDGITDRPSFAASTRV
jgi:threonine dehydrogenase-like Zn-dependent dehydrogenase